jgi:hypothetical protein
MDPPDRIAVANHTRFGNRFDAQSLWTAAWLAAAVVYAVPVCYFAYERVVEVTRQARERLIVQHRLWEVDANYQGSARTWTRVASHLLTDSQLLQRVRTRYGDLANEIELDYRRDLTIAQVEVIAVATAAWAAPVAAAYGLALLVGRRRRQTRESPKQINDAVSNDSRYRP